jgi:hypothetical protein
MSKKWSPRKNVFLLTCMDLRFLDDIVAFMDKYNLQNRYDHVVFAGASLGVLFGKNPLKPSPPIDFSQPITTGDWYPVFVEHLNAAVNLLHRDITDIAIMEHMDCGAYHKLQTQTDGNQQVEFELHSHSSHALAELVKKHCKTEEDRAKQDLQTAVRKLQTTKNPTEEELEDMIMAISYGKLRIKIWHRIKVSCFIMNLDGSVDSLCAC